MKITNKIRKKSTSSIIEYLSQVKSATRNDIIEGALSRYGLTEAELEDFSPKSKHSVVRSYIGTALNELVNKQSIIRDGDVYSLAKEELIIVKEDMCLNQIKRILKKGDYTKEELFCMLENIFGTDTTVSTKDDNSLRTIAGAILYGMLKRGEISYVNGKYTKAQAEPNSIFSTPLPENEFKPLFLKRLFTLGGSFFESFVANLLEKYFTLANKIVVYCDITGGSDDGGIDIVLEIIDYLGFVEKIKVQTKCRDTAHVNEKEVREFYGAMNAQQGTRGIYVTTTEFHRSAQNFIDSIDDLVGIDGDKLFELVKKTRYGIKLLREGYVFDNAIFNR